MNYSKWFDDVIGVEEAAELLNLVEGTVKNKCAAGELPAKKIGKTWVMSKAILMEDSVMNELLKAINKVAVDFEVGKSREDNCFAAVIYTEDTSDEEDKIAILDKDTLKSLYELTNNQVGQEEMLLFISENALSIS